MDLVDVFIDAYLALARFCTMTKYVASPTVTIQSIY